MKSFFDLLYTRNAKMGGEVTKEIFLPELYYEDIIYYLEQGYDLNEIDPKTGDNVMTMVAKYGDETTIKNFCHVLRDKIGNAEPQDETKNINAEETTSKEWIINHKEAAFYLHRNKLEQDIFDIIEERNIENAVPFSSEDLIQKLASLLLRSLHERNAENAMEILELRPPLTFKIDDYYHKAHDIALATNAEESVIKRIIELTQHYSGNLVFLLNDDDQTPEEKYSSVLQQILFGADQNYKHEGIPILNLAVNKYDEQTVRALIQCNANPFLCDKNGLNALHLANIKRNPQNAASYNIFNLVLSSQLNQSYGQNEPFDFIRELIHQDPNSIAWINQNNLGILISLPEIKSLLDCPRSLENDYIEDTQKIELEFTELMQEPKAFYACGEEEKGSIPYIKGPERSMKISGASAFSPKKQRIISIN